MILPVQGLAAGNPAIAPIISYLLWPKVDLNYVEEVKVVEDINGNANGISGVVEELDYAFILEGASRQYT